MFLAGVGRNPPGYSVDESAISYNAWSIATRGVDEAGHSFPLYPIAGGEYKNPVYIYLLAVLFRIFGPGVGLARGLSAVLGDLTAAALGWLAWSVTGRRWMAVATFLLAVVTPAIFEIAHLVFEVAAYSLVLALFLIAIWNAHDRWRPANIVAVGVTLALVTYTYSTGRLLGPLLAAGLLLFARRDRIRPIVATWLVYAVLAPIPMAVFHFAHDRALTARYRLVRVASESTTQLAGSFVANYFVNFDPIGETVFGDYNPRHHVQGSGGNILAATFVLAVAGAIAAIRRRRPWDRFLLYGLAVSLVPVSLTYGPMHILRAMPYVVFLFALSITGMTEARRPLLAMAFLLAAAQAGWFFFVWSANSGTRGAAFDCCVPPVLDVALAQHRLPIYVTGINLYPDVVWFGTLRGVDRSAFVDSEHKTPPAGAIAITRVNSCVGCRVLAHDQVVFAYVQR